MIKVYTNILSEYNDLIKKKAREVLKKEGLKGEVSITLVDDETMIELNKKYKNKNTTTDVLAFSFKEGDDIKFSGDLLGDLYISIEQAARQKKGTLLEEIFLLVVHGLLHLAGYNDETFEEKKIMREKEKEYL